MDRVKAPSRFRSLTRVVLVVVGCVLIVGAAVAVSFIDFNTARVKRDQLAIAAVEKGTLVVDVRANGQLLPRNVESLSAQVSGRVAKRHVQPGDVVKAGQLLLELTNPQLLTSAEEAYSAWEGSVKDFHATESELKTNLLNQEIVLNQAQFNLESSQLQLEAETELMTRKMVAGVVYKRTQLNVSQLRKTRDFEESRVNAIRTNIKVQLAVKQARVAELARTLERAKTAAANLRVLAGIDGIVQNLSADIGQELAAGRSFGRIAQPEQLYAELKVAAREASEVQVGQSVLVNTHNGKVEGIVSRVDPAISEGTVIVDVSLKGALPAGSRPQLAVEGEIFLARVPDALYVGKPAFARANSEVSVYKLDASGQYAERVVISAGRLSLTKMQVLQGLRVGDRIITSQAGDWQDKSRIRID
jgi:HlyD family secretion protein